MFFPILSKLEDQIDFELATGKKRESNNSPRGHVSEKWDTQLSERWDIYPTQVMVCQKHGICFGDTHPVPHTNYTCQKDGICI